MTASPRKKKSSYSRPAKSKWSNLGYWIVLGLNILLTAVTLITYLSPFVDPSIIWFFSVLSLLFPILLFFNFTFIIAWLFSARKYNALLSFGTLLLGYGYITAMVNISNPVMEDSDKSMVTLLSFNVNELQIANDHKGNDRKQLFKELHAYLILEGKPDIVCVQDLTSSNISFFKDHFNYKHQHILGKQKVMTGIFTHYKMVDKGVIKFEKSYNSAVWADLLVNKDTIRVYSVHLQSNRISGEAEALIEEGILKEEKTWKRVRGMLANYKRTTIRRSEQAAIIVDHIRQSPYPVIIGADLNDTPLSRPYRLIRNELQDGFKKVGNGLGFTYAGSIPGLRIDYIFAADDFEFIQYVTKKDWVISDHYPLVSKIKLPDKE
jgi:endonuclease/exonuclease/phosphatase family metal-dependent hydrolase